MKKNKFSKYPVFLPALLICAMLTDLKASTSNHEADVIALSKKIREENSEDDARQQNVDAYKHQLFNVLLQDVDHLSKTEKQAAYALALSSKDPEFDFHGDANLSAIWEMATPKKIDDDFVYIQMPQNGYWVVMERLKSWNQEAWKTYAKRQHDQVKFPTSVDKESVKPPYMWRTFLLHAGGLQEIPSRVDGRYHNGGRPRTYDIWVAYVANKDPSVIYEKRKIKSPQNNLRLASIDESDIEMVVTIQAMELDRSLGADKMYYSPMGISRTVEAAKKLWEQKESNALPEKFTPNLSIWFHALTCKLTQMLYPNVDRFWTRPTLDMAKILRSTLHPNISPKGSYQISQKIKNVSPDVDWKDEGPAFMGGLASYNIAAFDLLNSLFPYELPSLDSSFFKINFKTIDPENVFSLMDGFSFMEPENGRWTTQRTAKVETKTDLPNKFTLRFTGRVSGGNENGHAFIKVGSSTYKLETTTPWQPFSQMIQVDLYGQKTKTIEFISESLAPAGERNLGVMVDNLVITPFYINFKTIDPENIFSLMDGFSVMESEHGRWTTQRTAKVETKTDLPNKFTLRFTGSVSDGNENGHAFIKVGSRTYTLETATPWRPFSQMVQVDLQGQETRTIEFISESLAPAGERNLGVMVDNLEIVP